MSLLTVADLAARWQRSPVWVRRQAHAGLIPATRIGERWRFDPEAIAAYEQRHTRYTDPLAKPPRTAARRPA